jgi:hypothetical protein
MTHFPQVHPQRRSPRIQLGGSVLASVILEDGKNNTKIEQKICFLNKKEIKFNWHCIWLLIH